jgi:hypothetical protein
VAKSQRQSPGKSAVCGICKQIDNILEHEFVMIIFRNMQKECLLKQFIRETVVDASDKFAQKRKNDFSAKIRGIAKDFPSILANQNIQEKELNDEMKKIIHMGDNLLGSRARTFMSIAPAARHFNEHTPIIHVLQYTSEEDGHEATEAVEKFISDNLSEIKELINRMKSEAYDLEKRADSMEWAAPWRRYTQWPSFISGIHHFDRFISKF